LIIINITIDVELTLGFHLVKLDLSQNSIRRLSEKSFGVIQNTIEDLRLGGNLLGDTLNPIFSTTEFHGLSKLIRLDLSENRISSLEEGILKGCVHLEVTCN
jgi:Leucine-rich repeat (LRR) protein